MRQESTYLLIYFYAWQKKNLKFNYISQKPFSITNLKFALMDAIEHN